MKCVYVPVRMMELHSGRREVDRTGKENTCVHYKKMHVLESICVWPVGFFFCSSKTILLSEVRSNEKMPAPFVVSTCAL